MSSFHHEVVVDIHHWTDGLFSFRTTRDPSFRFRSGQFTMMGLEVEGRPLTRAYSIASSHYDDELEFFSIKVPEGPLTSRLQHLGKGDRILVGGKTVGTLLQDNLLPGKRLWLLSTGTGLAPFLSIVRDPETFERFETIVLVHGVRRIADLAYADFITRTLPRDDYLGALVREKLLYYPTVTREPYLNRGRVTDLILSGRLFDDLGVGPLDAAIDRVMLCGSPEMLKDSRAILDQRGFVEGSQAGAGDYVIEKAFVEK